MSFGDFDKTVFECNYHILIINLRNFKKTACQNLSLHYKTRKVSVDGSIYPVVSWNVLNKDGSPKLPNMELQDTCWKRTLRKWIKQKFRNPPFSNGILFDRSHWNQLNRKLAEVVTRAWSMEQLLHRLWMKLVTKFTQ